MEQGAGRPVLLVHGNPTWGYLWRKVARALDGAPLRLVMPDLIGLGLSDKPGVAEHSLENHLRWMGSLVEALDLEDAIAVGQDWGGPLAIGAFLGREQRLSGLVLANTAVGAPSKDFKPTLFHRLSHLPLASDLLFRGLGFPLWGLGMVQGRFLSIGPGEMRAYMWPLRRLSDRAAPLALARMVPDSAHHPSVPGLQRTQALAEGFGGPAALVWGTRDPILGRLHRRTARALPQASVTLTEAGHFLQEEVPDRLAEAIRKVAGLA
jgi:haloalkane dehalogenase